jgi:hypothetical protein
MGFFEQAITALNNYLYPTAASLGNVTPTPAPITRPSDLFKQPSSGYVSPIPPDLQGPAGRNIQPTPTPTPAPFSPSTRQVNPISSQNIPQTYYTNRNQAIAPNWWDAVMNSGASNYLQRLALALLTQESSGGYNSTGDQGRAIGGYGIRPDIRKDVTTSQAADPAWATQYLIHEMMRNIGAGAPQNEAAKSWNPASQQPNYTRDIPQMATTSSFYRGQ